MSTFTALLPLRAGVTVLRRLRTDDERALHCYRSDPDTARFQGWSPMDLEAARAFVARMSQVADPRPGEWVQLAIADATSDAVLGDVGLHLAADLKTAEVGFTLAREARGQGHAVRAARAAAGLLNRLHPGIEIRATTDVRNAPCVRVLEGAGFHRIATREAEFKGERCTEWVYRWQAIQVEPLVPLPVPDAAASVSVQPATVDDALAIAMVHVRSWQSAYAGILDAGHLAGLSIPDRAARWQDILRTTPAGTSVAVARGRVVGFVSAGPCRDEEAAASEGEIWTLYVAPEAWGGGVGRALLAHALAVLKASGFAGVSLWVLSANHRGRRFYEACGFRAVSDSAKVFELAGQPVEELRYRWIEA